MDKKRLTVNQVPRHGTKILGLAIAISLLVHLLSYINLNAIIVNLGRLPAPKVKTPVKVKIVEKNKPRNNEQNDPDDKQIVEVKQQPTEKPVDARYKSFQDHKTDKETKLREFKETKKAADAGGPKPKKRRAVKITKPKQVPKAAPKPKLEIGTYGDVEISQAKRKEKYKALMPTPKDLAGLVDEGYQQYIDDKIELGDRIDINTTEYRYMGYFTNMRKAIELVWNYPVDAARRGMQGEVRVEFVINKEGHISRVRVLRSSGYKMLDNAIVEALQLASPFPPLPEDFGERKLVTGSFRYILSSYYAGSP